MGSSKKGRRSNLAVAAAVLATAACTNSTGPDAARIEAVTPPGWSLVGPASATYVLGLDHQIVHGGHGALAIQGTDTSRTGVRGIVQFIKADDYRGQRVRLSGWVRQTDIRGTDIGLWMRVDGPGVIQGFDNFSTRPLTGTSDWHQVEIILDVPDDAIGISLGALMSGAGVFRVDDLKFEVIPPNGLTTNILLNTVSSSDLSSQYAGRSKVPANLDFEQ